DAPLEPDPIFEGKICDRCMMCVKECPAGAIDVNKTVKIKVAGREFEWGELNEEICSAVYQAGTPEYSPFMTDEVASVVREVVGKGDKGCQEKANSRDIWGFLRDRMQYVHNAWESYHHPSTICGGRGCIRACMIHLEQTGRISNIFKSPFRKRDPWRLD
ncbi:MAG: hypothetical protein ACUVTL_09985, partial [Thermoproteota archaeon]